MEQGYGGAPSGTTSHPGDPVPGGRRASGPARQRIRFATAADGVRVAYAVTGSGPALVTAPHWISHIERDPASPVWRHWSGDLASRYTLVRYDQRGHGLSDRQVADQSLDAWVGDLAAVVDAAGLDRFVLLGSCQGAAASIGYAARHPDRVRGLVLYGAYARGRRLRGTPAEEGLLLELLINAGWGRVDSPFGRGYANLFLPDAPAGLIDELIALQGASVAPEEALRISTACAALDLSERAGRIRVPTLVLHLREDRAVPFEEGRRLAGLIPGSRFVPLPGHNHLLLPDEPGWAAFLDELAAFVAGLPPRPDPGAAAGRPDPGAAGRPDTAGARPAARPCVTVPVPDRTVTAREREVLALVARGHGNEEIATRLGVSVRTVERHLSNVYGKLGVAGKSARAAAAAFTAATR